MPKVTIEVSRTETSEMHTLIDLERRLFPGERVIQYFHGCRAMLEVEGDRAAYVLDMLRIETDDVAFEPFASWKARGDDQADLPLFSDDDPIHATAS